MRCRKGVPGICLAVLLTAGLAGVAGCNKLRSRDLINRGIEAYKQGEFDQAEADLRQAADLDPENANARLYLATAYASQFVPGSPSPDNMQKGQEAIAEFQKVLELPASALTSKQRLSAIDGVGSMLYNLGANPFNADRLNEAKKWQQEHIALEADDPAPYYWIGVIDWTIAYRANLAMRQDYNADLPKRAKPVKLNGPLPERLRQEFETKYAATVDEGIEELGKAMQLRPDYTDAMAYVNLLDRQKAEMAATPEERQELLNQADALVNKVNQIKQSQGASPKPHE